ncbi:hypothetical protein SAMN04487895_102290 [Paenibacillus sophorae]|uniref:Uncharacterized protein n=1 Tax=Paenibacillus sophorae TaxID=1333845 RepID=A0A1H8IPI7_9BACL|nr:hypothetical protein [Paenibacillus sophorae]QWU16046.1 hypothetical protein KP014_01835 [Paenibacillus sophorae]SEN70830.1 hypothetical protein SAMN04487895_102290 [Paenibacillus sophorae]
MEKIEIINAKIEDGKTISKIIRESFKRQSEILNISESEYPHYVAFETEDRAKLRIINTEVKILIVDSVPIGTIGSSEKVKLVILKDWPSYQTTEVMNTGNYY